MLGILLLGTQILFVSALYVTNPETCSELLEGWNSNTILSLYWILDTYWCFNQEYESRGYNISPEFFVGDSSDKNDIDLYSDPACFGVNRVVIWSTRRDGHEATAEVVLFTDPGILVGGVAHSLNRCTSSDCFLYSPPWLMKTAPLMHSPLAEEFWSSFKDINISGRYWITEMEIKIIKGNIPSQWVSQLTSDSIRSLTISGNDWRRPQTLLGYFPNLEYLYLRENNIEVLPNDTFSSTPNLKVLSLSDNRLLQLPFGLENHKNLLSFYLNDQTGKTVFDLSDSDLPSLSMMDSISFKNVIVRIDLCNISELVNLKSFTVITSQILSGRKEDIFCMGSSQSVKSLTLIKNGLTVLPSNLIKRMINIKRLNIAMNQLTDCEGNVLRILSNMYYLDMSYNRLRRLTADCFRSLELLRVLKLSNNKIESIEEDTFSSLVNLRVLHLSRNKLVSIEGGTFAHLRSLRIINLSFNKLINIHYSIFLPVDEKEMFQPLIITTVDLSHNKLDEVILQTEAMVNITTLDLSNNSVRKIEVSNVEFLNLSHNSLDHIPDGLLTTSESLESVDLGGNNLTCCHPANVLLINSTVTMYNLGTNEPFYCFLDDQKVTLQSTLLDSSLCVKDERDSTSYEELWALLGVFAVVAAVFMSFVFHYHTELAYLGLFAQILRRGMRKDEQKYNDAAYDAFVCYRGKDLAWIVRQLLHSVEDADERYRLCIHHRDFTLGAAIVTNLLTALDRSRKVIFVLSPDFMSSKWCRWELEMATYKMFEEERQYIILIELESLEGVVLPRQLKFLMKSRTCLRWPGDSASEDATATFWKGLRKALGPSLFSKTGRRLHMISVMDIEEQIHTTNE